MGDKKRYYVDSCIWLNLFKKEINPNGIKDFWKIAEEFILEKSENDNIIYTGLVFRELEDKINDVLRYKEKLYFIKEELKCNYVKLTNEDYDFARKLEKEENCILSFYDFLHIAVCKRTDSILITRDNKLIEVSKKYILVFKPEDLIS